MTIKILFFGDIVGRPGRRALANVLPKLKQELKPDLTIANAENLAHGIGVTKKTLQEGLNLGIDFYTSGNHIWKKTEIYEIFQDSELPIIRPANYPESSPGKGQKLLNIGTKSLLVVNLNGRVFMEEQLDCPFQKIDQILAEYKTTNLDAILVDFHAEATSEKVAFGWYVDGRVSAVLGTHTHIPTCDQTILPKGTAFVSDVGMVAAKESVIGVDKYIVIKRFLTQRPESFEIPESKLCVVNAVFLEIDTKTKKATKIQRIDQEVEI